MSMRPPFSDHSYCDIVSVDINIVPPDFPICSLPPFTSPILIQTTPEIFVPDIDVPVGCACITIGGSGKIDLGDPGDEPELRFAIGGGGPDCCNQEFGIDLSIKIPDIPCLPLAINTSGSISVGEEALIDFTAEKDGETGASCAFDLNLDIEIPCLPDAITADGSTISRVAVGEEHISVVMIKDPEECAWDMAIDVAVPFPCPAEMEENATIEIIESDADPVISLVVTQLDDCSMIFGLDIKVPGAPCPSCTDSITADASVATIAYTEDFDLQLVANVIPIEVSCGTQCQFTIDCDVQVPEAWCLDLTINEGDINVFGGDAGLLTLAGTFFRDDGNPCRIELDSDITFPKTNITITGANATKGCATYSIGGTYSPNDPVTGTPGDLTLTMDLDVDCFSCGNLAVDVAGTKEGPGIFTLTGTLTPATGKPCTIDIDYDISFPPVFDCTTLTITTAGTVGGGGTFDITGGSFDEDCQLVLNYTISFPSGGGIDCSDLTGDSYITVTDCDINHVLQAGATTILAVDYAELGDLGGGIIRLYITGNSYDFDGAGHQLGPLGAGDGTYDVNICSVIEACGLFSAGNILGGQDIGVVQDGPDVRISHANYTTGSECDVDLTGSSGGTNEITVDVQIRVPTFTNGHYDGGSTTCGGSETIYFDVTHDWDHDWCHDIRDCSWFGSWYDSCDDIYPCFTGSDWISFDAGTIRHITAYTASAYVSDILGVTLSAAGGSTLAVTLDNYTYDTLQGHVMGTGTAAPRADGIDLCPIIYECANLVVGGTNIDITAGAGPWTINHQTGAAFGNGNLLAASAVALTGVGRNLTLNYNQSTTALTNGHLAVPVPAAQPAQTVDICTLIDGCSEAFVTQAGLTATLADGNYLVSGDPVTSLDNDAGYITCSQVPLCVSLGNIGGGGLDCDAIKEIITVDGDLITATGWNTCLIEHKTAGYTDGLAGNFINYLTSFENGGGGQLKLNYTWSNLDFEHGHFKAIDTPTATNLTIDLCGIIASCALFDDFLSAGDITAGEHISVSGSPIVIAHDCTELSDAEDIGLTAVTFQVNTGKLVLQINQDYGTTDCGHIGSKTSELFSSNIDIVNDICSECLTAGLDTVVSLMSSDGSSPVLLTFTDGILTAVN